MQSKSNPRYTRGVMLQQFARPFVERGGSIESVLHRNGIPDAALRDPKRLVEASAFYAALEDMADALKDPYFGATVARNAAFEGVPSLRAAASTAITLGDFLIGAILEVDLQFDNVAYDLRVSPGAAVFQIQRTRRVERPTPQADAIGVVFYTTVIKLCLGARFDPQNLLVLAHSFDGVPKGHLPARVLAQSKDVALAISFPPDWLKAPFRLEWRARSTGDYHANQSLRPILPLAMVREVLQSNISSGEYSIADLASACGLTPRALQRLLAKNGTSFRTLRDEICRETAKELVLRSEMPLKEIAVQTGFSSVVAFGRSYKRWTGTSPGAHRLGANDG